MLTHLLSENIAISFPSDKSLEDLLLCLKQPRPKTHLRTQAQLKAAQALKCNPAQLDFLYDQATPSQAQDEIFDFPDSERRRRTKKAYFRYTAE